MEKMTTLSVVLAVYNEESNLADCLDTIVSIANEIVIVDGQSTDRTAEIASRYHAKIISVPNQKNFHHNKNLAIQAASCAWVLQLDADERVSSMLAKEIVSTINLPQTSDAYYLKRRNYFLGRWMNKGGMYPDPVIRLFKKGRATLPAASVHELMQVNGQTGWLNEDLLHLADPTFSRYLTRSNRYTSLAAEDYLKENKLGTDPLTIIIHTVFKPLWRFLLIYFRHKGFQDGFPGFVFAYYSGLHLAGSYIKYWEKKTTKTGIDLEHDWE